MALHTVGAAKSEVQALLQGQNLNKVGDINAALERAARTTIQQAAIPEASGVEPLTLYGGVYQYLAPTTIFGSAINLLRRQGDAATPWDYNYKVDASDFTRAKGRTPNGYMLDFEYRNGSAYIGVSTPNTYPKLVINPMNEVGSAPNAWVVGGSASALAKDATNYFTQPASLRFLLTGSSAGYIEKTLQNSVDLTDYAGVGVVFLAIQTPNVTNLTSLAVQIGSDSSNYVTVTATTGFLGAFTVNNWLLVALNLSTGVTTGTPNYAAINYVRATVNHTATITNFRMGGLFTSLPVPHEILFQSSAVFLASGSTNPSQSITGDGDTIILNDAAYNLFIHEAALTVAVQEGGTMETGYVQMLRAMLYGAGNDMGLYARYRADNPSVQLRQIGEWYDSVRSNNYYD
jgi:hypothetical protein